MQLMNAIRRIVAMAVMHAFNRVDWFHAIVGILLVDAIHEWAP